MSCLITVLVVFQIVVWSRPSELGEVLLVVELQEVCSLSTKAQKRGRQASRQGHEPLGAADTGQKENTSATGWFLQTRLTR